MAQSKKKSVMNAKVVKKPEEPKMPTKEELFKESVLPTFESFVKASKEKFTTAEEITYMMGIVKSFNLDLSIDEVLKITDSYRKQMIKYIEKNVEKVIKSWDYESFSELDENPFKMDELKLDTALQAEKIITLIFEEKLIKEFVSMIVSFKKQLANCE